MASASSSSGFRESSGTAGGPSAGTLIRSATEERRPSAMGNASPRSTQGSDRQGGNGNKLTRRQMMLIQCASDHRDGSKDKVESLQGAILRKSGIVVNRYHPLEQDVVEAEAAEKKSSARGATEMTPRRSPRMYWADQKQAFGELFCTWLNVLLIFVPVGLIAHVRGQPSLFVFVANFLAIIPLAGILGGATEAVCVHTGQVIGGLVNATLGNLVEMIMCIQAVRAGLIRVVQGNLVGSILSNLLLVLGMSIAASGLVRHHQVFNAKGANANMLCLLVGAMSVALPTVFELFSLPSSFEVIEVSRACSVFLIGAYGLFLTFMMRTHRDVFEDDNAGFADEEITLSLFNAMVMLSISTVLICLCSAALVSSIQDVSEYLPEAFIGVILLPIVGNASEHALAVHFAFKGMMDLALGVAVGSSICIALLVVPVSILYGWAVDQPMNLAFRDFDTLCMLLSVFLVSQVLQHGQTNWLHGAMLIVVYLFIATQTCYIRDNT